MAREKLCIGIDIGASSVKLCQLKRTKKGLQLENFGLVPLPSETIVDGALMNGPRVVDAIRELVSSHHIKARQAAIAIAGHSVIIKKIALPQMTRDELDEAIHWEAEQFIPFDIDDVNIDVQIVNQQSAQQGQMDVVLVAAKKDYVNEYTSVIAEAGLDPMVCDVDAFAVQNMFETNYEIKAGECIVLVNVGASKSTINIVANGISTFTRDLNIGGNAFTEEIQRQLNVSYEEAEALKLGGGASQSHDAVVPQEVETAIRSVAENVTSELQRSIDFYAATSADSSPSKVYLTGGTAKLQALSDALSGRLGIPIEVADPFRNIQVDARDREYLTSIAPAAAVSVGLALRFPGDG